MANKDVKKYAKDKGVMLWEIAYRMGMADTTFSRKLRLEFNTKEKADVMNIIDIISMERK